MIIGLTGSIGMGKSTVAEMFRHRDVPVFCMDAAVQKARGPYGAALEEIEALIPGSTTREEGVDRNKLREFAFASPDHITALQQLMQPHVERQLSWFFRIHDEKPLLMIDAPLLFEIGFDKRCDFVVVVSAPAAIQMQRILARNTMTEDQARIIIARQMPNVEKVARADFVIDTGASLSQTEAEVEALLIRLD